jgi:hypothetical protein
MVHGMAVLSLGVIIAPPPDADRFPVSAGRDLTGLSLHQDPPPPRV